MNVSRLLSLTIVTGVVLLAGCGPWIRLDWWFTPDQMGDRLLRSGKFAEAAHVYADPLRQGVAWYRAGDFTAAKVAFARSATPEGAFNLGNSFVMLGKYDEAINNYDRALSLRSDWPAAVDNRSLAILRRDRRHPSSGDQTQGSLPPDGVVFDKHQKSSGETVQVNEGPALDDAQLQQLWLRRVQTKPADFLRSKFAFQAQQAAGSTP